MRAIFVLLTLTLTATAGAEENPILKRPALFQTIIVLKKSESAASLDKMGNELEREGILWFGYPQTKLSRLFRLCNDQSCQVSIVLAANNFSSRGLITSQLKDLGAEISTFVTNEEATFAGISAKLVGERNGIECEASGLSKVSHWRDSIAAEGAVAAQLRKMTSLEKMEWIQKNLVCDKAGLESLGEITSMQLQIVLANAPRCPLNKETLKSCFIGRGILIEELPF